MRILLDENFPLALVRRLQREGYHTDHIILLGMRGTADRAIVTLLDSEDILFLAHDQEFFELAQSRSRVIVSRVTQSLPITARVEIWCKAIFDYFSRDWHETIFEVLDDGELHPWERPRPN